MDSVPDVRLAIWHCHGSASANEQRREDSRSGVGERARTEEVCSKLLFREGRPIYVGLHVWANNECLSLQPRQVSRCLLTPRDMRLVRAQDEVLENAGVLPTGGIESGQMEALEEVIQLIQLLAKLTGVMDGDSDSVSGTHHISMAAANHLVSPRDFISRGLTWKLTRQLGDTLAVTGGAVLPDWCSSLTQRVTALFPYNVRFNFFRACAFGPTR